MKAIRFDGDLKLVTDARTPVASGDEAVVEVICAGICNTDLEIVKGYAGFHGILGHEFVGRIVECADRSRIGQRVVGEINAGCGFCRDCISGDARHCRARTVLGIKGRDGAFAEYLSLPTRNLLEVPEALEDTVAVFVEPLAAACEILEQVDVASSSSVAVIGDGKLSQLILRVLATTGAEITVIGKHAAKLELAAAAGVSTRTIDPADSLDTQIEVITGSRDAGFDIVVEASGSSSGLSLGLRLVKPRGTVVLKSTHQGPSEIVMSQVVVNELTIVGSRCGRFARAISLLDGGSIDVLGLVTASIPMDDWPRAFSLAADHSSLKVVLSVA